ncbi:type II secretion system minor pseudopilin GspI [Lysobacter sp. SG-8]|uniref:Type II secretion system protein I n=1 Tax=Marilutibacter penaei TaxID=2759900 RepID=A0A7W3U5K5_9GAMM|nr:type II secretion system minor pseudopilin GspI [Lysobacter penaei]MBB1089346.1 type II secretion system minor pseudopilin GspI [Lysobacter penaei]
MRPAVDAPPRGFSLLEVLVALAVFGLVVLGLLNLGGESSRAALIAEERVLAGIVAENRAIEALLADATELQAMAAATTGVERMGDRDWHWRRRLGPAEGGLLRVDVDVTSPGSGQVIAERHLLRPAP